MTTPELQVANSNTAALGQTNRKSPLRRQAHSSTESTPEQLAVGSGQCGVDTREFQPDFKTQWLWFSITFTWFICNESLPLPTVQLTCTLTSISSFTHIPAPTHKHTWRKSVLIVKIAESICVMNFSRKVAIKGAILSTEKQKVIRTDMWSKSCTISRSALVVLAHWCVYVAGWKAGWKEKRMGFGPCRFGLGQILHPASDMNDVRFVESAVKHLTERRQQCSDKGGGWWLVAGW